MACTVCILNARRKVVNESKMVKNRSINNRNFQKNVSIVTRLLPEANNIAYSHNFDNVCASEIRIFRTMSFDIFLSRRYANLLLLALYHAIEDRNTQSKMAVCWKSSEIICEDTFLERGRLFKALRTTTLYANRFVVVVVVVAAHVPSRRAKVPFLVTSSLRTPSDNCKVIL